MKGSWVVDARGVSYFRASDGAWYRPGLQPADGLGWPWRNLATAHGPLRITKSPLEVVRKASYTDRTDAPWPERLGGEPATATLRPGAIGELYDQIRRLERSLKVYAVKAEIDRDEIELLRKRLEEVEKARAAAVDALIASDLGASNALSLIIAASLNKMAGPIEAPKDPEASIILTQDQLRRVISQSRCWCGEGIINESTPSEPNQFTCTATGPGATHNPFGGL